MLNLPRWTMIFVCVGENGILDMEKASRERGDGKWTSLKGVGSGEVKIYKECRKVYTHPEYISQAKKKKEDAVGSSNAP
jgi:hypothetical protein